ncbi:MAG: OmpA family protein [Bacteroidia bacterium]|nr:OmpA family protein [Bacteroidia bacterium]
MTVYRYSWLRASIFLLILAGPMVLSAQVEKTLRKADLYFRSYNMVAAEDLYNQVLEEDPNNFTASYQLGRVYNFLKDYREALRYFTQARSIDPNRNDTVHLQIGLVNKLLGNYRAARESFEEFKRLHKVQDELYKRADLEIKGCDIAEASLAGRPMFRTQPVSFNSAADDRFPAYLDQNQEDVFLAFASGRPLAKGKNKRNAVTGEPKDTDIYSVIQENDSIFAAEVQRFPYKIINTRNNDGPASFTGDGLTMYFTICNGKDNPTGCSIYESKYSPVRKEWSKPVRVEAVAGEKEVQINTRGKTKRVPTDDRQPFVTRDGRTLFFVSDRPGGQGGFDLWFSRKIGAGWSAPENLGSTLNTPFDEVSPFFNNAGNRLYFASEGLGGFGGLDLYYSDGVIGSWSEPVNLGAPINSSYNDFGSLWMDGDSSGYFTSDRPGGAGSFDIYWAKRLYYPKETYEISVKGIIRDRDTKQPVEFATAILFLYTDDNTIMPLDTFQTDQDARYEFPLEADQRYKILGNADQYLANEEEVSTAGIQENTEIVRNIDISLEPIVIDAPIVLQNIYYDFDEYYLRPDALVELKKLLKLMRDNPNLIIQLNSHTDSNGTEEYNKVLSNNRAKAVVAFLADNQIDPARLTWYGFGESQPLVSPELSDEDEQANRRTEFQIISIDF